MTFMVARHSPKYGLMQPLSHGFSAHSCTLGREIGLRESYPTREEAAADAERLESLAKKKNPEDASSFMYRATLIAANDQPQRNGAQTEA